MTDFNPHRFSVAGGLTPSGCSLSVTLPINSAAFGGTSYVCSSESLSNRQGYNTKEIRFTHRDEYGFSVAAQKIKSGHAYD